jgi:hypothetical protein
VLAAVVSSDFLAEALELKLRSGIRLVTDGSVRDLADGRVRQSPAPPARRRRRALPSLRTYGAGEGARCLGATGHAVGTGSRPGFARL